MIKEIRISAHNDPMSAYPSFWHASVKGLFDLYCDGSTVPFVRGVTPRYINDLLDSDEFVCDENFRRIVFDNKKTCLCFLNAGGFPEG